MKTLMAAAVIGLVLAGPAMADEDDGIFNFGEVTCKEYTYLEPLDPQPHYMAIKLKIFIDGYLVGRKLDKALKPMGLWRWLRAEYCPTHPDETLKAALDTQVTMLLIQLMPKR